MHAAGRPGHHPRLRASWRLVIAPRMHGLAEGRPAVAGRCGGRSRDLRRAGSVSASISTGVTFPPYAHEPHSKCASTSFYLELPM